MITDTDLKEAIDRIARTADGEKLYRYLQKVLCGFVGPGASDCALRHLEGRRSFAAELMGLMAEGIDDRSGSDASSSVVTFRTERAVSPGRRTIRERIAAGDIELSRPSDSNAT